MIVTRLAWMAHRLQSSKRCTRKSSVASWMASRLSAVYRKGSGDTSLEISLTKRQNGAFRMSSSVLFWNFLISFRARVPGLYLRCFLTALLVDMLSVNEVSRGQLLRENQNGATQPLPRHQEKQKNQAAFQLHFPFHKPLYGAKHTPVGPTAIPRGCLAGVFCGFFPFRDCLPCNRRAIPPRQCSANCLPRPMKEFAILLWRLVELSWNTVAGLCRNSTELEEQSTLVPSHPFYQMISPCCCGTE